MKDSAKAKIFLAGERGHTETECFRSYNTFQFGKYRHEAKTPFGPLYILNDDTLAGGKKIRMHVEEDSILLVLPTVGAVHFAEAGEGGISVQVGGCLLQGVKKDTTIELSNPFENDLINYLQVWFKAPQVAPVSIAGTFEIEASKNSLVPLFSSSANASQELLPLPGNAVIGKFAGRSEGVYKLAATGSGVFVFVVEGAFEVQNRLLQARDALALTEIEKVEFEALSLGAIIMIVEVAMT